MILRISWGEKEGKGIRVWVMKPLKKRKYI